MIIIHTPWPRKVLCFACMNNQQKGSSSLWVIVGFVIVIAVAGYFYQTNRPLQVGQVPLDMPVETNANVQPQPPAVASVQNCGEVINVPSSDTAQQQKNTATYACMSSAMVACSPAIMIERPPSGTGTKTFEILSGGGAYCPISETIGSPPSKMTCDLPSNFISTLNQFLQTKNQQGMLFDGIPFFFVPSSTPASARPIVKNPLTGQVITVHCSSS